MINFRYHIVSLTSVFLALAIGLVLGTAALNGPILDNLNDRVSSLSNYKDQLRDQVRELEKASDRHGDYTRQLAPTVLGGKLRNRSVALVDVYDVDGKDRENVVNMLKVGGARITGSVRLNDRYLDPNTDESLHDLASRRVPAGVKLPESGAGAVTASTVLAALLTNPAVSVDDRTTIMQAFTELGVLTPEGKIDGTADSVVFLFGSASTKRGADDLTRTGVTAVKAFAAVTKVVAAAPSAGGGANPIAAIRSDGDAKSKVSTVDGLSRAEGQLATAMALVQKYNGGNGHYGTGDGASAQVPKLS
ncbi:MAG: copper transporter [Mycobacteriales bacterium]